MFRGWKGEWAIFPIKDLISINFEKMQAVWETDMYVPQKTVNALRIKMFLNDLKYVWHVLSDEVLNLILFDSIISYHTWNFMIKLR